MPPINHHVTGQTYWRSLEQLADSPEIRQQLEAEFPGYDPQALAGMSRRRFMQIMGASLALAGLTLSGCRRWPKEKLAPYSSNPKGRTPGIPEQYATVMELGGVAVPLLVSSFDGRPIKIEGNPTHPLSATFGGKLGAADAIAQATVLELYDPDRSRLVIDRTSGPPRQSGWDAFASALRPHFASLANNKGAGFAVLCESSSSPSLAEMKKRLLAAFPQCQWHEYEPLGRDNERAGAKLAFGQPLRPYLHLDKAAVAVLFDADLLGTHPAHVRYANDWVARRKSADQGTMSRVYVFESALSLTGSVADHRLPVRPSRLPLLLGELARQVGVQGAPGGRGVMPEEARLIEAAARDLKKHKGQALVAAGAELSPEAHALVCAINHALGAAGSTISYIPDPAGDRPSHVQAITRLSQEIKAGRVSTLLILGGNPAYDAPVDLDFAAALASVPLSIHLSLYANETSAACRWHLPRAHYLEAWGDGRAFDGSLSIVQPLIEPLYGGKSPIEVLALILNEELSAGEQIVRRTFASLLPTDGFEKAYRRVLHDGLLAGSAPAPVQPALVGGLPALPALPVPSFEIRFQPDLSTYDGRFANIPWLQEMPDPITKLTWDNAALISKKDADALGVKNGDVLKITANRRTLEIAAYILPGQPAGVIGLPLGYGRTAAGHVGNNLGFNTYALRTTTALAFAPAEVSKTGRQYTLAMTQDHHLIDELGAKARDERVGPKGQSGRIIREATFEQYKADPHFAHRDEAGHLAIQLFQTPSKFNDPHAWGMAVDMASCIGCNACVVACQAENNIPVVGKDQVLLNREMHWIRIDRYFKGSPDDPTPEVVYQPLMCQHCETAPCEQVCPVAATVHDSEGLNTMVYNRCIGTRYCSNNCPYKVRRFNYFDFHSKDPRGTAKPWLGMPDTQQQESIDQIKRMVFNPDVSVRMRGVMEKCTYCVQRIRAAQSVRRNKNEDLQDGDVVTACQQACPTQAIVFGNLNDPNSRVAQLHKNNRAYGVLEELNTRPRTKYLAKLRNPASAQEA